MEPLKTFFMVCFSLLRCQVGGVTPSRGRGGKPITLPTYLTRWSHSHLTWRPGTVSIIVSSLRSMSHFCSAQSSHKNWEASSTITCHTLPPGVQTANTRLKDVNFSDHRESFEGCWLMFPLMVPLIGSFIALWNIFFNVFWVHISAFKDQFISVLCTGCNFHDSILNLAQILFNFTFFKFF